SVAYGYTGATGPDHWGSLSPRFSACSSGKNQSPVNINKNETVTNKNLKALVRDYKNGNATLYNNGNDIGINYDSSVGVLLVDGKNFSLKNMHFHIPSEHRIDGVQFPAELHLFHTAPDGSAAVVAILYELGDADPLIDKLKDPLDQLAKDKCASDEVSQVLIGTFDTKAIRRKTRKFFRYKGSLTTPPCTENVTWNVLGKVRTITKEQVEALTGPLDAANKKNARPVQALNGRKIELYDELGD
ncbi:Carb_anhydrase domain-containing protein, partial [Cephalotus follicularis]